MQSTEQTIIDELGLDAASVHGSSVAIKLLGKCVELQDKLQKQLAPTETKKTTIK
jgi:hypothetical protein